MTLTRARVTLAVAVLVCASCSKGEPPMSTTPPPTLSSFTALSGGFSEAIAPGAQIVTLSSGAGATWWEKNQPVTAQLPPRTPASGARWTPDGKALRVGLGTLDLATRTWKPDPALAAFNTPGPRGDTPVRAVAWLPSTAHLALLLETRSPQGARATEIVIAGADGRERGRRAVDGASALSATDDRVIVAGKSVVVLDLDAKVIAEPAPMPASVTRVREGGGIFAAIGAAGAVALVRPSDGAVLATWDAHAVDAVPVPRGVVAIDLEGNVRVGCLEGSTIRNVAEAASGMPAAVIQLVDHKIVVAGAAADPVRVATFASPCK